MNLNAREKLVLVVVLVIVIWIAGIIAFIKPAIDSVKATQNTLDQKKIELEEKKLRIEEDKNLKQDIRDAYNKAVESGEIFYPRMVKHDAATLMQGKFNLDGDEGGDQELKNDNLSVSNISAVGLNRYVYTPPTLNTTLDNIVNQMNLPGAQVAETPTSSTMTAYTFSTHFSAKKEDIETFMDKLLDDDKKSLVLNTFSVQDVGKNDEGTEWECDMSLTLYMIPQLRDPDEVNADIENGMTVNAVADIAE